MIPKQFAVDHKLREEEIKEGKFTNKSGQRLRFQEIALVDWINHFFNLEE